MLSDYIKTCPQYVLPKKGLTTLAGLLANVKTPWIKNHFIKAFIHQYKVNMTEALEENPEQYACFNDFFIRRLKPESRPIASADVISPVDGFVSEIGTISDGKLLQAKGLYYTANELLSCHKEQALAFNHGAFATLYLSPKDYHRVHMPMEGTVEKMIYVPGKLFSVQPATARLIPRLFARNERLVVYFSTNHGQMAMVLVGATIVGGIGTQWHHEVIRGRHQATFDYSQASPPIHLSQADEMGYFKLGSTVILLFEANSHIHWLESLQAGQAIRFGEAIGEIK